MGHFGKKGCIYALGRKLKDYAKIWTQKRNTYGRGPRHFEKNVVFTPLEDMTSNGVNLWKAKKVGQKHRHFWKFCVITYEGAESSDTFRKNPEYTLRE